MQIGTHMHNIPHETEQTNDDYNNSAPQACIDSMIDRSIYHEQMSAYDKRKKQQ